VNRRSKIDRDSPRSIEILPDRGDASYAVSDGGLVRLHAPDVHLGDPDRKIKPNVTLKAEICCARNGIRSFLREAAQLGQAPRASATVNETGRSISPAETVPEGLDARAARPRKSAVLPFDLTKLPSYTFSGSFRGDRSLRASWRP
jgi:hypothetical protein